VLVSVGVLPVSAAFTEETVAAVAVVAVVLMRATVRCASGVGAKCRVMLARAWCAFCHYMKQVNNT
jgi:hypothetical protein